MLRNEKLLEWDSLLRIFLGTVTSIAIGFIFVGQRTFHLSYLDSPFLSIGIAGSLVYVVYKEWGVLRALGIAFLLSIVNAGLVGRNFVTVSLHTLVLLSMVVVLCHYLAEWKVEKPQFGRMLLLAIPFAIGMGLITLVLYLYSSPDHALVAAKNNTMHGLQLGVALGIGLELAELIIRRRHHAELHPEGI